MDSQSHNFEQAKNYFLLGLESIRKESYEEAEHFFTSSLILLPDRLSTITNLFAVLIKLEKLEKANNIISKAIILYPADATTHFNQGQLFTLNKNLLKALESYDKAIDLRVDYHDAKINRELVIQQLNLSHSVMVDGARAAQNKQYDNALELLYRVLEIDISNVYAYNNLGNVLKELNRLDEALANYDKAIAITSDYAEAYNNRGTVLKELNRLDEALANYDKAIEFKSDYAEAYINRGTVLKKVNRLDEALANCDKAIEFKPDLAEAYNNRGNVLIELNRLDEALANYDKAIEFKPDLAEAYNNRGNVLIELNRLDEALANYDKAIAITSDYAEAYSNRGNVLKELNRLDEALANYDKAIEFKSDYAEAYLNKSLALLLTGEYGKGWDLYEWRWMWEAFTSPKRNFSQSLWMGNEDIAGKTVLLHAEQGLGDTIQFCRYASFVKERGARVVLEVPQTLIRLLAGLDGVDELVENGKALPPFDYHCPLLSLPRSFKTELTNIPNATPYLFATADKCSEWAQRLRLKTKPRVGLVWSGNAAHKRDYNRSLILQKVLPYLPDYYEYVSLQKEVREIDKKFLAESGIRHYGDELTDFTDTAALCELMDIVISVDTSVAHLAGAIGKTTWVLLSYSPDWRWLLNRNVSSWYESVRLYRQLEDRSWDSVIKKIAHDLSSLSHGTF
jgi:tetratricopeptide (TPR) repeat protein